MVYRVSHDCISHTAIQVEADWLRKPDSRIPSFTSSPAMVSLAVRLRKDPRVVTECLRVDCRWHQWSPRRKHGNVCAGGQRNGYLSARERGQESTGEVGPMGSATHTYSPIVQGIG